MYSIEVTTTYTNLCFVGMIGLEPINLVPKTNAITEVTLTNTTALPEKRHKSMNLFSYIPIICKMQQEQLLDWKIHNTFIIYEVSLMYTMLHF